MNSIWKRIDSNTLVAEFEIDSLNGSEFELMKEVIRDSLETTGETITVRVKRIIE